MIGVHFKRCVRDVMEGRVAEGDVTMIIGPADTTDLNLNNTEEWETYFRRYSQHGFQEWYGMDCEKTYDQLVYFKDMGQLFYPSDNIWTWTNGFFKNLDEDWYVLAPAEEMSTPAVKQAYETYRQVAGLCK